MTTEPNRRAPNRGTCRPRRTNPYQGVPMPVPLDGWNLRAADIFRAAPLASLLSRNARWLQARPRTSEVIEATLFPEYTLGGMDHDEVRAQLNCALFDAGYEPDDEASSNPTWFWTEGN
ncbi:hypothetical protein [Geothrix mesophila]|uniref:hypothetical protein n=1 Tax=Geothrix mesophila TaxID=2922723 RepID=UPI001FAE3F0D|nr:hypothetical protein [Geothrix sp. SG198]